VVYRYMVRVIRSASSARNPAVEERSQGSKVILSRANKAKKCGAFTEEEWCPDAENGFS
jgi:hypothetical protein